MRYRAAGCLWVRGRKGGTRDEEEKEEGRQGGEGGLKKGRDWRGRRRRGEARWGRCREAPLGPQLAKSAGEDRLMRGLAGPLHYLQAGR